VKSYVLRLVGFILFNVIIVLENSFDDSEIHYYVGQISGMNMNVKHCQVPFSIFEKKHQRLNFYVGLHRVFIYNLRLEKSRHTNKQSNKSCTLRAKIKEIYVYKIEKRTELYIRLDLTQCLR
jgi:hypothetical protein